MLGLIENMDGVREICSAIHAVKKREKLPKFVREVLILRNNYDILLGGEFAELIRSECNISEVNFDYMESENLSVGTSYKLDYRKAGPVLGKDIKKVSKALLEDEISIDSDGFYLVAGVKVHPDFITVSRHFPPMYNGYLVTPLWDLDMVLLIDPFEYPQEYCINLSSIIVKAINSDRKDQGLAVGDRGRFKVVVPEVWENLMVGQQSVIETSTRSSIDWFYEKDKSYIVNLEVPGTVLPYWT